MLWLERSELWSDRLAQFCPCAGSVAVGEVLNGSTSPLPCGVVDL